MQPVASSTLDIPVSNSSTSRTSDSRQVDGADGVVVNDSKPFHESLDKSLTKNNVQVHTDKDLAVGKEFKDLALEVTAALTEVNEIHDQAGVPIKQFDTSDFSLDDEVTLGLPGEAISPMVGALVVDGAALPASNISYIPPVERVALDKGKISSAITIESAEAIELLSRDSEAVLTGAIALTGAALTQSGSKVIETGEQIVVQSSILDAKSGKAVVNSVLRGASLVPGDIGGVMADDSALINHKPLVSSGAPVAAPIINSAMIHQKISFQLNNMLGKNSVDAAVSDFQSESESSLELDAIDNKTAGSLMLDRNEPKLGVGGAEKVIVSAQVRVGMPGWADQIAERTANLASQNIKQAEIQLNPQEMGPINVKISVNQDQVAVTFTAQNLSVREALDQGVQRLRETLESEGMDLIQADVSDQSAHSESEADTDADGREIVDSSIEGDDVQLLDVEVPSSGIDQFA